MLSAEIFPPGSQYACKRLEITIHESATLVKLGIRHKSSLSRYKLRGQSRISGYTNATFASYFAASGKAQGLVALLAPREAERILDLGCKTGALTATYSGWISIATAFSDFNDPGNRDSSCQPVQLEFSMKRRS